MTKQLYIGAGIALIAGLLALWWFGFRAEVNISGIEPDNPALVATGARLYAAQCASCHGRNLEGQTANWQQRPPDGTIPAPPHDESGHSWHHTDRMLFEVTKYGRAKASGGTFNTNMIGFEKTLSDREIWAVLSYIKSTWPEAVQRRHDDINRRAAGQ